MWGLGLILILAYLEASINIMPIITMVSNSLEMFLDSLIYGDRNNVFWK